MYGSSFCRTTLSPRDLNRRPREAVVMPLPSPEATPPVTKMNLVSFTTGSDSNRRSRRDRPFDSRSWLREPAEPVEPAERRDRLDRPRERDGLREDVEADHDRDGRQQPDLRAAGRSPRRRGTPGGSRRSRPASRARGDRERGRRTPPQIRRKARTSTSSRTTATTRNPFVARPGATSRPFQTFVHPAIATRARRLAHRCSRGVHATVTAAASTAAASFSTPVVTLPSSTARR